MKQLSFIFLFLATIVQAQVTPTPDKLWGQLFKDVQLTRAFGDNKTFVDMVPQQAPQVILNKYAQLKNRDSASLRSLAGFVGTLAGEQPLYYLFNFSERPAHLTWYAIKEKDLNPQLLFNYWTEKEIAVGEDHEYIVLEPYLFYLLEQR